jgi:hypothetical protein
MNFTKKKNLTLTLGLADNEISLAKNEIVMKNPWQKMK